MTGSAATMGFTVMAQALPVLVLGFASSKPIPLEAPVSTANSVR
jgi:hypothetical protein